MRWLVYWFIFSITPAWIAWGAYEINCVLREIRKDKRHD